MPTIFQLDQFGQWTGQSLEVPENAGWPVDWTFSEDPPPAVGPEQAAIWFGGSWVIGTRREPVVTPAVRRITKIEFSRLFTNAQLIGYLALKAQAKALSPADFADPAKAVLIQAAVMFEKYDMLPDLIELDYPETIAGVDQVLVAAGVLTADEAARILANVPPAE